MTKIPVTLEAGTADGKLAFAENIFNASDTKYKDKFQSEINMLLHGEIQGVAKQGRMFPTLAAVQSKITEPAEGDWVIITATTPAKVYVFDGTIWQDSGIEYEVGPANTTDQITDTSIGATQNVLNAESIYADDNEADEDPIDNPEIESCEESSYAYNWKSVDGAKQGNLEDLYNTTENNNKEIKQFKKTPIIQNGLTKDLDVSDEQGNVILRLKNGHIKTKNFDSRNSINSTNPFYDKNIAVLGDSITWLGGDNCDGTQTGYEHKGWTEYFKEIIQPKTMKSYARSGATLSCFDNTISAPGSYSGGPAKDNVVCNQVIRLINDISSGMTPPDYIIILAGCNDSMIYENASSSWTELHEHLTNLLSDNVSDILNTDLQTNWYNTKTLSDCSSIAKTLRWIKDALISECPKAQVVITTPLQSHYSSLNTQNIVSQRIEECASYLSWPIINQGKECFISRIQEAKHPYYTYDGTHTSIIGATMVGHVLANKFKSIIGY